MAKHITRYPLNNLDTQQFAILLLEASQALRWQLGSIRGGFSLAVPRSAWSNGQTMLLIVEDGYVNIESKNIQWQFGGGKKNEQNLAVLTAKLDEVRAMYTPEQLTEKYNVIAAEQEAEEEQLRERIRTNTLTTTDKIALNAGGTYVTYTLIGINILVFLLMAFSDKSIFDFSLAIEYAWGGNVRSLTAGGEWYRLLTNIFLHGGLIHVAFNMYALLFIGIYLEPLLGRWRYLTVYLACGVFASLTSIWWSDDRISVGASGAIFGLYGVFLALLTTNFLEKGIRKPMLQSIGVFVVFNLVYGVKAGIDNAAHVGGLLSGAAFGYLYYLIFSKKQSSAGFVGVLAVVTVAAIYTMLPVITKRPQSEFTRYINSLERFDDIQARALIPIKKLSDTAFSPALGEEFRTVSLPAWLECKAILDSGAAYKLQAALVTRNNMLKRYVDLRIKSTQLYIKQQTEKSNDYNSEIESTNQALGRVMDSLNKE